MDFFLTSLVCVIQLLCALNDWIEALDNGNSVDVLYLDFKKVFDSVLHARLLKKVHSNLMVLEVICSIGYRIF